MLVAVPLSAGLIIAVPARAAAELRALIGSLEERRPAAAGPDGA